MQARLEQVPVQREGGDGAAAQRGEHGREEGGRAQGLVLPAAEEVSSFPPPSSPGEGLVRIVVVVFAAATAPADGASRARGAEGRGR